jgi:aspartate/methionine/tyrosine aminotransferase
MEASVLIVAGEWFGMDGYLRVGIGGEEGTIQLGLERLAKLLDSLRIA